MKPETELGTKLYVVNDNGQEELLGTTKSSPINIISENIEPIIDAVENFGNVMRTVSLKVKMAGNDCYHRRKGKRYVKVPCFNSKKFIRKIIGG